MTKAQIIEALKKGCEASTSEYMTVRREHLLIAIGAQPEPEVEVPSVEPSNQ
jgi:hypothetical protein